MWETVATPLFDASAMIAAAIVAMRLAGLRSFSKMSGFDFPITVATGSLIAAVVINEGLGPAVGIAGVAGLFGIQVLIGRARRRWRTVQETVDNAPLLLMEGPRILEDNLRAARMTRADLLAKLRENNVTGFDQVQAVVLETTGDVSVMTGDRAPDPDLLAPVRRKSGGG